MRFYPDMEELKPYAEAGYKVAPVCCEMYSDSLTPIAALRILKGRSRHCYMLESAKPQEHWGRYTFLGYEPSLSFSCLDGEMIVDGIPVPGRDPAAYLRILLRRYTSPRIAGMPPFTGGLVGYFAYDYIAYSEPSLRIPVPDSENFRDVDLMLFDKVIAFDNLRQKIILIANANLRDLPAGYEKAREDLLAMRSLLLEGAPAPDEPGRLRGDVTALFSEDEYCQMVERAKYHIREGDIFQIVLSNRLSAPFEGSLLNTYRALRTVNPSPYMFYLCGTDVEVAGASPETLVKLEDGTLHTFPLAGTRPRGSNEEEDSRFEAELLADEKELAEHNMLVDLGRNDLGRVSEFGSVRVEKLREIQRYSHVMHIGSTVRGRLREGLDAFDAIAAVLPAGTLSGAPKIKACELIARLEHNKRGIYGGAVGYIDFTGNMDTCIAIRIAYQKNDRVFVRSGAGIVADSVPEREYTECVNKARAVLQALRDGEEEL